MASRIYQALNKESQEIRLVTILPALRFSATIKCTLSTASLSNVLDYAALSYTWGDPKMTRPVLVGGLELNVTYNLESALRHIRRAYKPVVLWVDAICIDQSNIAERNHQVRLMQQIYTDVDVIVWLGEEDYASSKAIRSMRHWGPKLIKIVGPDSKIEDLDSVIDTKALNGIYSLLSRPWWSRLWTVQEVVLGKSVNLMCGTKRLSWDCLNQWVQVFKFLTENEFGNYSDETAADMKSTIKQISTAPFLLKVVFRQRFHQTHEKSSLFMLLTYFQYYEASEPLDKIYALLGLAVDSADFAEPDYSLPVSTVYSDVAKIMVQRDETLQILRYSGIALSNTAELLDISSWIPDWQPFGDTFARVRKHYCVAKETKAMTRLSSQYLITQGVLHDKICFLEPTPVGLIKNGCLLPLEFQSWTREDLGSNSSDLSRHSRLQQYFRTVLLDCDVLGRGRLAPNSEAFYDNLDGFMLWCLACYKDCEPSTHFVQWLRHEYANLEHDPPELVDISPLQDSSGPGIKTKSQIADGGAKTCSLIIDQMETIGDYYFMLTEKDAIGMAPPDTAVGDIICVLLGHDLPVILRPKDDHYVYVGECFVLGIMDGEALQGYVDRTLSLREFNIA